MFVRKNFQYRAYLPKSVEENAIKNLHLCCELYNAALQERRDWWRIEKFRRLAGKDATKGPDYYSQQNQLPEIKVLRPEYSTVYAQTLQNVVRRVDGAFQGFFRRVKAGQTPGYPRFKSRHRYNSLTYNTTGWKLKGNHLTLSKIGKMKLVLSRPIEGRIKTVTLKRDSVGDWFVTFSCDQVPVGLLPETGKSVGIDLGLGKMIATSDGEFVDNPRHLRKVDAELRRTQRKLSKRRRGGSNRNKLRTTLARKHRRLANVRKDFHFKTARKLVESYDVIAVEDLKIQEMQKNRRLAKSIGDIGWGQFINILEAKAEGTGRKFYKVDPKGTTQNCSSCGQEVPKDLSVRVHDCPHCGLILDRDVNAAINILKRVPSEAVTE